MIPFVQKPVASRSLAAFFGTKVNETKSRHLGNLWNPQVENLGTGESCCCCFNIYCGVTGQGSGSSTNVIHHFRWMIQMGAPPQSETNGFRMAIFPDSAFPTGYPAIEISWDTKVFFWVLEGWRGELSIEQGICSLDLNSEWFGLG